MKKSIIFSLILAAALSLAAYAEVVVSPSGYTTIKDEGVALPKARVLNIAGSAATCAGTISQTTCTITGGVGGGQVDEVVAGENITVDSSDPARPIVSATASGGTTTQLPFSAITGSASVAQMSIHTTATGTNVHGLRSMATQTAADYSTTAQANALYSLSSHTQAFSTITGSATQAQVATLPTISAQTDYLAKGDAERFCAGVVSGGTISAHAQPSNQFDISPTIGYTTDHTGSI